MAAVDCKNSEKYADLQQLRRAFLVRRFALPSSFAEFIAERAFHVEAPR
ncbi:hypothetical protein [Methylosinus sporium]